MTLTVSKAASDNATPSRLPPLPPPALIPVFCALFAIRHLCKHDRDCALGLGSVTLTDGFADFAQT